eukprot:TRINITY_DN3981_c0_g2_i1.p1 TRINITY_DN3981_c0_g2~~TRINITY_DN3981_c0_g2_i1.p1  ORF type:complete len:607 (+),score=137.27 TRINITY_DN3981_c0_g2_i1:55-1821(+)
MASPGQAPMCEDQTLHAPQPPRGCTGMPQPPPALREATTLHMNAEQWAEATERRGGMCPLWTMVEERLRRWPGYASGAPTESRYRAGRVLGRGSFGTVRLVQDVQSGQRRAMKSLERPSFCRTRENMERWRRILTEVEVIGVLDHPNCIKLIDVLGSCRTEHVHIITEYSEQINLDRFAAQNPIGERDASEICYHVLRALHYLHDMKRIVHRDIKPENILISWRDVHRSRPVRRRRATDPQAGPSALLASAAGGVIVAAIAALVSRCSHCDVLCCGPWPCCGECGRLKRQREIHEGVWSSPSDSRGEVVRLAVQNGRETHEQSCNMFDVKLIDFGVARHIGVEAMTTIGPTPVGSHLYLSLETIDNTLKAQKDGCSSDSASNERALQLLPRVDIFSLGVVGYILLCRVHPFRGTPIDDPQTMRGKMLRGVDFPVEAWGEPLDNPLSDGAKSFLSKLLALDPEDRPTAAEALRDKWVLGRAALRSAANENTIRQCGCPRDLLFRAPEEVGNVCIAEPSIGSDDEGTLPASGTNSSVGSKPSPSDDAMRVDDASVDVMKLDEGTPERVRLRDEDEVNELHPAKRGRPTSS